MFTDGYKITLQSKKLKGLIQNNTTGDNSYGNNLNQISRKANKTDLIDKDFYKNEAIKWNKFMSNVKEEFL